MASIAPVRESRFVDSRAETPDVLAGEAARFRAISDMLSDVAWVIRVDDRHGLLLEWASESFERVFGYRVDEWVELGGWPALVHPDDAGIAWQAMGRLVEGDDEAVVELRVVVKDGTTRFLRFFGRVERDADSGAIRRLYGAAQDLTEQRAREAALERGRRWLDDAQRIGGMGSWRRDVATGRMEWSDELYRIAGYEPGAIEPTLEWLVERVHPDDRPAFVHRAVRLLSEGEEFSHEFRFVRRDGDVRWIHSRVRPEFDPDGHIVAACGVTQDVTERRRSEELHRVVSEMVSDIVFSYDVVDDTMVPGWVTESFARTLGHPAGDRMPSDFFRTITHPEDLAVVDHARDVVLGGDGHVFEFRVLTGRGAVRWLRVYAQPVRDDRSGAVVSVHGAAQDVTDRKDVETALRRAYERERDAASRLREADQMKDEFLATASHELRTPLAAIVGFASLLAGDTPIDPVLRHEMGRKLERNALELGDMVERLLDFSRLEAGAVRISPVPVWVAAVLGSTVEMAVGDCPDRVRLEADPDVRALADVSALHHIVSNLVSNALKYTPEDSPILVSAGPEGRKVVIRVSDSGPGLAPDVARKVFDRFYRGPDIPTGTRGTGIGLSIARSYTTLLGGRIWVETSEGDGATFGVELPAASADVPAGTRPDRDLKAPVGG